VRVQGALPLTDAAILRRLSPFGTRTRGLLPAAGFRRRRLFAYPVSRWGAAIATWRREALVRNAGKVERLG